MFGWLSELFLSPALAEAASGTAEVVTTPDAAGLIPTVIAMAGMFGVLYLLMIRPQRKKDKAVKEMLKALKPGDRVCTIGGIYGTITGIKDDTVTIAVGAQKAQLVMARWAIRSVEDAPLENDSEALV